MKTIFTRGTAPEHRLLLVFFFSILLMVTERYSTLLMPVRTTLSYLVAPAHYFTYWPVAFSEWWQLNVIDRHELIDANHRLEQRNLILQRRVQKMAALAAENIRLRALLNSSALLNESVIVAEVIGIDPNPFTHEIILNRGIHSGVVKGQAVLDARGLMGQVTQVEPWSSRVMLISDTTHALPVEVNRNGVRAIAAGGGFLDKLYLKHIPDTADIREGDLLVSSGLGGRFPFGYPVAEIVTINHYPGRPFAEVIAKPKSQLDRVRHVLLVMKAQDSQIEFDQSDHNEEGLELESDHLESVTREMDATLEMSEPL